MKLYACVYVSDFPVAVKLRERWNRQAPPALVFTGEASHAFVHAANAAARKAGIREGMTLSQAEGRFIVSEAALEENLKLLVEPRDEEAEKQAQRELLDAALEVCPSVENSRPGLLVLDLTGLPDPHGAAGVLAHRVEQLGLPGNVAVSQNRFVAVSAARTQEGVTHVFPDQARGFLHGLPIDALPLTGQEQKTIGRWGVRTVGEFARLPQDSLAARFGQRGAILSMLARGEGNVAFEAWEPPHVFEESLDFDWEIRDLELLSFPLAQLLEKLCEKLRERSSAAEAIRVSLKLADRSKHERTISLPQPLVDADAFLKLIRLELTAHPPPNAIEGLTLHAKPVPQRITQGSLFAPPQTSPAKLAVTLTQLKELVGARNVGAPGTCDTHRPRAFSMTPFRPSAAGRPISFTAALAFRSLRPAVEAEVLEKGEQPAFVSSQIAAGPIRKCAGPWRAGGDWWSESAWELHEWDIELSTGLYRLCCDLPAHAWRLVGVYD